MTKLTETKKRLGGSEKNVLMDVVARTADGREIVIEMQQFKKTDFKARMFYYGAAMVRSQLRRGKNYSKLKPVYVISFMNFRLRHSSNRLVYRYKMMEEEIHEIYGDWLSIYLCELPRLKKRAMSEMNYVEGWLHILRESVNFAGVPEGMDAHFSPVVEAARLQTVPEDEMMNYFKSVISDNERLEYGEDRFAEGLAEGLAKGKTEVANNLLAMGISSETVSKATGLSAEEIAAL